MEARGRMAGEHYVPDRVLLYTAQVLTQQMYPEFITAIRDLAGGGMIMLPSSVSRRSRASEFSHNLHAFRTFDWSRSTAMVDTVMDETPRAGGGKS